MGAEIYSCEIAYKNKKSITPELEYQHIKIRKSKAENTLGFWLEDNKVINLLNKLGYPAAKYGKYTIAYVPPYRLDVFNEQDVIEDIAIAYGYENIAPMPVLGHAIGKPDPLIEFSDKVSKMMTGLGFTEAVNFYLLNEELNFEKMEQEEEKKSIIKVTYAKTSEITMLRTSLLPWLLENLSISTHEKMPQKIFEIDRVFSLKNEKVVETMHIALLSEHTKADFSEIKSVAIWLLKFVDVKGYSMEEFTDPVFIDGRAARIMIGKAEIGHFGEIHPKVLNNFKLEEPVVALEINLERLMHQ
jgi:phenylalanyl-tRNA synthetase beta chain